LEALGYLIQLNPSISFTKEYVRLNDNIIEAKAQLKDKYAGIVFKTEEKEIENSRLTNENIINEQELDKRRDQLLIAFIALFALFGITFIMYRKYVAEKRAKLLIARQKTEIEILQKELHHRLKNNLSFIDLFIGLAKGKFSEKAYQNKLTELQHRINSMFQVHLQLFKEDNITSINFKRYVTALLEQIANSYGREGVQLNIIIDSGIELKSLKAFPIGLIVNEFVTNSFKYAFPNNGNGDITISFQDEESSYELRLKDKLDSFGLETMKLLTLEQKGTFILSKESGVEINISFPKTEL
jgi:two-component sensor histidine kinase